MNKFTFERGHSAKDLKIILRESDFEGLLSFQLKLRPNDQVICMLLHVFKIAARIE